MRENLQKILPLFLILSLILTVQAHAQIRDDWADDELMFDDEAQTQISSNPINDPHEELNRKMFNLNTWLMEHVGEPVSKTWDFLIPQRVQKSFDNFFSMARTPSRFFNCLFQKKYKGSATELSRLLINSTLGIGGLFDPAEHYFRIKEVDEDFSQTLAYWGMDEGTYWVVPVFGPATTRDVVGFVGNTALNPFLWLGIYDVDPEDMFRAMSYTRRINNYSYKIRSKFNSLIEDAIDPYSSLQHAYIHLRRKKVNE